MAYTSIIDWITGVYSQHGWADPIQANPYYPFGDAYNLPYDIGMKLWNIIGGAIMVAVPYYFASRKDPVE